ncbi:MAG: hypothetical protein E7604_13590 [Ruminococcaceae bacterium]|nr:hypothetical protein [Oscillospiraceae bacterium]
MRPRTIILIICVIILLPLLIVFSVPLMDWLLRIIFRELQHGLVGVVLAVVLGIAQLLLCFLTKRLAIRLIPIEIILLGYCFCLFLFFGMKGIGDYIAAMIFGIIFSIALSGVVLAWLIYGGFRLFIHFKKRTIIE